MSFELKVLYIVGWGRSGSTILDNILGQVDGFFSGGELYYVWDRGLVQNRRCGCGVPFRECEVWRQILARASTRLDASAPHELIRLARESTRTRHLASHLLGRHQTSSTYREALHGLYGAIADTTGARVIVDSSKSPSYAAVLGGVEGFDLRLVHLVRDPRATAYSWSRRKLTPDEERLRHMRRHGAVASSVMWDAWNAAAKLLWRGEPDRYLMLRYEDFLAFPQESVRRVVEFAGEPARELPFASDRTVRLEPNHTVSGNPSRFRTGLVELEPDQEWVAAMRRRDRALATAVASPLLRRFGYPIRPQCRAPREKEVLAAP